MKIRNFILVVLILFNLASGFTQTNYSGRGRPDQLILHTTPSVSLLSYKSLDSKSTISGNIGTGLEYGHFFNEIWGLSIGAEITSFSTFYHFKGRKDSLELFDNWSSRYYKLNQNLTTKEFQSVTYLSFPVKINYRHRLTKSLNFNVSAGAAYTLYFAENKSIVSGTIDRQAFFGDIYVNIDEFYPLMFGKFTDYINPSSEKQFKSTLLGVVQMGLSFNLADNWNMHTELNFQYGFQNIKTRSINLLIPDEYSGVTATNYIGEIHPLSLGLRIGVAYNFDLFGVDCKCHNTWYKK
ncbi:MAG: hypothetical protein PHS59_13415 [Paludibacter sp.]|nr:hypothetical protein [Paludibacter sp.]